MRTELVLVIALLGIGQASEFFHHNSESDELNEIDSNEYVDKLNKYGHKFNHIDKDWKKYKHYKSLHHDIDVNFSKGLKKVAADSEIIGKHTTLTKEKYLENFQNKDNSHLKRDKKNFFQSLKPIKLVKPPTNNTVLLARYIVHTLDWAVLGTLSARSPFTGAPFVCAKALSDGPVDSSTGVPYFYMSSLDLCTQDLEEDNRVSMLVSLSQTDFCKESNYDPQDPRCAKMTISGEILKVKPGSEEEKFAKNALFTRHPVMKKWPKDHQFFVTKLNIKQIVLLDRFGGAKYINVQDYFNAKPMKHDM